MKADPRIRILLYTRQPFVAIGLRSVLNANEEFRFAGCCDNLAAAADRLRREPPDILLVHLMPPVGLAELAQLHPLTTRSRIVLWGDAPGGDFAYQSMRLGVRAMLPSCAPIENLLTSLRSVHGGVMCFEKGLVDKVMLQQRIALSKREGQLVSLVAQGLKNKAIGARLGITEGTVKVYLYKLFKKLGLNDRLEMALYGLENLCAGARMDDVFVPQSLPLQPRVTAWSAAEAPPGHLPQYPPPLIRL